MADIFISYARSTEAQATQIADALRGLGYDTWRDDDLPSHRTYADVIEEQLQAAKAVLVIWSPEAVKSHWVRSEADRARADGKLVQLQVEACRLPMPFDQIQCADLTSWSGAADAPGFRRVAASLAEVIGAPQPAAPSAPSIQAAASLPAALALPAKPSIAVLPFANLGSDAEQDYFVDGMMEEIVTSLSRHKSIFVIASGSTLSLKGREVRPTEVGQQLGVRYVLEGSVRKSGQRVRITVRLIDASDGSQVWGDRFDDTLDDVFALQDKVALSIAGIIEPRVRAAEIQRASRQPTDNMGSYDLYLRAVRLRDSFREADAAEALGLLERAIALDPEFALAQALAASCHSQFVINEWPDADEHQRAGIQCTEQALRHGADDAVVLAWVSNAVSEFDDNRGRAIALADRAVALNPGYAYGWFVAGIHRMANGDPEEAIERFEMAGRLDPLSRSYELSRLFIAGCCFMQGRMQDAVDYGAGSSMYTRQTLAVMAAGRGHLGRIAEGRELAERFRAMTPIPIEDFGHRLFSRPEHQKLYADGIALLRAAPGA
jgi:adenylate cyclase